MSFAFDPGVAPHLFIKDSDSLFPLNRVHCVAKNYGDHIREMGGDPAQIKPKFFSKSAANIVAGKDRLALDYPLMTQNYQYEVELVVALGPSADIFAYGVGIDFTKRDLQQIAKKDGMPWDTSKNFLGCACVGALQPIEAGDPIRTKGSIQLLQNGTLKQDGDLAQMIYGVSEILDHLNGYDPLQAGDIIFTGTPAGVGRVEPGDEMACHIEGLDPFTVTLNS